MKSCPHCGSTLSEDVSTLCPKCGKQLLAKKKNASKKNGKGKPEKKKAKRAKKKVGKYEKRPTEPLPEIMGEPVDDGYDGYYNDVLPPDIDRMKDGLDKELMKKVAALISVVIFVIGLCVALLYIL